MVKKNIKELLIYLLAGFLVWCCVIVISEGETVYSEITKAIGRCINIIIPSLFAFMAISGIIINSGLYIYISKPFYPITKYIMGLPNSLFFVFLLGNVSGYPIGAKLLVQLKKEHLINAKTAEVVSCFCYGGGPAFFAGTIGLAVYNNSKVGILIFISVVSANFIMSIIMCRLFKPECKSKNEKVLLTADNVVDAVISAGKSLFVICSTIIFFAVVMAMLDSKGVFEYLQQIGFDKNICTVLKSFLEVSYISDITSDSINLLPLIAGVCSFGGVCVLMQIKAVVGKEYSLKLFIISRLFGAVLSALICRLILIWFTPDVVSASANNVTISIVPDNFIPSICLISMIFIIALREKSKMFRKRKKLIPH